MSCKNKVSQGSKNTLQKEFEMVKTRDLTDFFPKRKKTLLQRSRQRIAVLCNLTIDIGKYPGTFYDKKILVEIQNLLDLGDLSFSSRNF
jgi:hypothetical protein